MISISEMFKIGIGPSSSHTVGPMKAAGLFLQALKAADCYAQTARFAVHVYGSLSLTGIGHGTDGAILAGLAGEDPKTVDTDKMPQLIADIRANKAVAQPDRSPIALDTEKDFIFHKTRLSLHENGMTLQAFDAQDTLLLEKNYYSIGGGFVVEEEDFSTALGQEDLPVPYPYRNAADLLAHCEKENLRLSTVMLRNESALHQEAVVRDYCQEVWGVMRDCIARGLEHEGVLPGKLRIPRRAAQLHRQLEDAGDNLSKDPMFLIDWLNMVAMAVNEENAAGGRVVTAPTNGACGIVPAVLAYYERFVHPLDEDKITRYLLTCSAIGSLYKMNASISGAEVGCQGEVGVACSMAAAGLTDLQGGTAEQVCEAAEIAMEHHLGLTCDPVAGQVQVPCIERNAVSAVKAVNAARMSLMRRSKPVVSLDEVIKAMYETGKDMNEKYRETSTGGLAMNVPC